MADELYETMPGSDEWLSSLIHARDPRDASSRQDEAAQWIRLVDSVSDGRRCGLYYAYLLSFLDRNLHDPREVEIAHRLFVQRLTASISWLEDCFWRPILEGVSPGVKRLIVSVPSWFAMAPLQAACPPGIAPSVVPSIRSWIQCENRSERPSSHSCLLASPATGLPFATQEVDTVGQVLGKRGWKTDVAYGASCTRDAVTRALAEKSVVHFAGHARNQWGSGIGAVLHCADGELSTDDVHRHVGVSLSRLVVLSACETGLGYGRGGNEATGLPASLIELGVATVIASQWPVDDVSTSLLMSKLYQEWLGGAGIADALQTARHWLRSLTQDELAPLMGKTLFPLDLRHRGDRPFESPYYWASFTCHGAA